MAIIDYSCAVAQADDINQLSNYLDKEILKLENLLARIRNEWKGPASDAFQNQLLMLIADMRTTRNQMSGVSSSIMDAANRLR